MNLEEQSGYLIGIFLGAVIGICIIGLFKGSVRMIKAFDDKQWENKK